MSYLRADARLMKSEINTTSFILLLCWLRRDWRNAKLLLDLKTSHNLNGKYGQKVAEQTREFDNLIRGTRQQQQQQHQHQQQPEAELL